MFAIRFVIALALFSLTLIAFFSPSWSGVRRAIVAGGGVAGCVFHGSFPQGCRRPGWIGGQGSSKGVQTAAGGAGGLQTPGKLPRCQKGLRQARIEALANYGGDHELVKGCRK